MERIDLSMFKAKSPQQKQLVAYEKLLQQSEKDFESLQSQFEELERELEASREDGKRKDKVIGESISEKNKLTIRLEGLELEKETLNKNLNQSIQFISSIQLNINSYLETKWIKAKRLQLILNDIKQWKISKNNS
jgi:chromosome segregation ATPase